jgi:hypothetical protein
VDNGDGSETVRYLTDPDNDLFVRLSCEQVP